MMDGTDLDTATEVTPRRRQFCGAIAKLLETFIARCDAARDRGNPEAIHDLRVVSRRLRAALQVLAPFFPRRRTEKPARRLKRLTRGLGGAREWDVIGEMLGAMYSGAEHPTEQAAIEHLLESLASERARARRKLVRALARCDARRLASELCRLLADVESRSFLRELPRFAWEQLEGPALQALAALPSLTDRDRPEELHMVRIRTKKLRYVLELMRPAFVEAHAELLASVKEFQEILGRHHDAVVLETLLQRELSQLEERGRAALVQGVRAVLRRVRAERRAEFAQFVRHSATMTADAFAAQVRAGLGMDRD